jgi:WD40 repeat protein
LQHVSLKPPSGDDSTTSLRATCSVSSNLLDGDFVESLSSERSMLLSLSSTGAAALQNLRFPSQPEVVALNARSWVSHLCMDSSGPYAAFGTSSTNPLRVYSITNDELSRTPSAILHTNIHSDLPLPTPVSNAVYGISRAPLASPWGASPQILVSGWFDGLVRCHDLRSSSRVMAAVGSPDGPAPLRPVLTMKDPLQLESIYSVSCGGGSSSHVAAGSARHSVVSFWDIRSSKTGWSVHAPGNDRSPVYSVVLESSRLYGATQSRPFVYDFVSVFPSSHHA